MPTVLKFQDYQSNENTTLTTGLNSLASGASIDSAAIDNTSTGSPANMTLADFEINLASVNITSATGYFSIYLIPSIDGTNYPDYTTGTTPVTPAHYFAGQMNTIAKNGTQRQTLVGVQLPPGKFKVVLVNNTGVALAASSNVLTMRRYSLQSV